MNNWQFHMPVQLIHGEGVLAQCGVTAAAFGKRCLIMTSPTAAQKSRAIFDAMASLKAAKVDATVYPLITANPTLAQCLDAANAFRAAGAHSILAIGGGSVMDAAKATAWLAANDTRDPEKLYGGKLKYPSVPLMLCGTTAGTGSEVSAVAVITDDSGKKRSVKHAECFADVVFADPRYTDTMSRKTTVSTALDALAHAVEGYLSPACDTISTLFAEQAFPLLRDGLLQLCQQELPDKAHRDKLFDASLYAGFVLNTCGTAFPHPMGYVLTEDHGIPHGQACAVFMNALLDCAKAATPARVARLFELFGGEDVLRDILNQLVDVRVTMTDEQLTVYRKRFENLPHYARVPGGFDGERAEALCRQLFT